MITTRRSTESESFAYEPVGGVSVLERPQSMVDYQEEQSQAKVNFSEEEAKRKSNLEKLLNYDRYSEQVNDQQVQTIVDETVSLSDEDLRPTSTTMQFGEDIEHITNEMYKQEASQEQGYRLNGKGTLVVMLYSLVVAVIMALIVLNTGVLATLSSTSSAKAKELANAQAQFNQIQMEIDQITSPEQVIESAKDFGMIQGN